MILLHFIKKPYKALLFYVSGCQWHFRNPAASDRSELSSLEGKARKSVKYRARESTTYCLISSPSWTLITFWRRQKCPNIRRCGCWVVVAGGAWPSGLGLRVARPPPSLCRRTAHSRRLRHCYITRVVLGLPKRSWPRSLDKSGYTARQNKQRRLISQRLISPDFYREAVW